MTFIKKVSPFKYNRADMDQVFDALNGQAISVMDPIYGALGNDSGDDAPAIQAAINDVPARGGTVYLPPGIYRVTSSIVFPTDRQVRLIGAGAEATRLHVTATTSATPGIIHIQAVELRSSVEYLQIAFDQPDTSTRIAMTPYVPAIYAQGISRFRVEHVRIVRAWNGIDMRGNTGGAEINDLEISHFNIGINIDGALDSIRIDHLHDWVFGCSINQQQAVFDPANNGILIGRADGCFVDEALFLCGTGIKTIPGVVNGTGLILHITNTAFDTFNGIRHTAGRIRASNTYFTCNALANVIAINATPDSLGTEIQCTGCYFFTTGSSGQRLVSLVGAAGGSYLEASFNGCLFTTGDGDHSSIVADGTGGGVIQLIVDGNHFHRNPNIAYANATIGIGSFVRGIISNNITIDKGTGGGNFILGDGSGLLVEGNHLLGWGLQYTVSGPLGGNNGAGVVIGALKELMVTQGYLQASGSDALSTTLTPAFAVRRFTGTLDGAGAATFAHGLNVPQFTGLIAQAYFKGGGGGMSPMNITAIDGTNIIIAGGGASQPYRVTVMYSSNAHSW